MLLPVVNPNLRTIEPREMWERYGVEALITNSYVIWKHDDLREQALADGIHNLLDFPGVVVTDSGAFQSYVYGDVEVGAEEIVAFQRDIGVDIGQPLRVADAVGPEKALANVELVQQGQWDPRRGWPCTGLSG
jgi:7-cyano-7-deazaguanine tRNA-ribosyltransferase